VLVIFLSALPLTEKGIDTTLRSQTQPGELPGLQGRLREIYTGRRDKTMFIAGAGSLRYQSIIDVLDAAKGAGIDRVGIITEGMRLAASTRR